MTGFTEKARAVAIDAARAQGYKASLVDEMEAFLVIEEDPEEGPRVSVSENAHRPDGTFGPVRRRVSIAEGVRHFVARSDAEALREHRIGNGRGEAAGRPARRGEPTDLDRAIGEWMDGSATGGAEGS